MVKTQSQDRYPRTSITAENIRAVRKLLEDDRRLTIDEIVSSSKRNLNSQRGRGQRFNVDEGGELVVRNWLTT